ncbi:MAG TPA: hotdog domain-containing protein [Thermoanaerobaculia bacterium]|nr:hotdog domain-containing protein [Thermoanaerobaculia bacterium]
MHDGFIDDPFNPRFVHLSPVHLDELDGFLSLRRERFAPHIDEAIAAWQASLENKSEQSLAVREISIDLLEPLTRPTTVRVDVWVERLENASCVFGFLCSSPDGRTAYARGERTITKLDPARHQPAPWSLPFRTKQAALLKNLPAYA